MPFCSTCGAEVKGAFCPQCGAAAAPGAPHPAPPAVAAPVPVRKISPIVWILGGIGLLFVLGVIVVFAFVGYVVRNPERAMARMISAANPDAEILRYDKAGRTVTIRDKRDGSEVTLSFDDLQQGRFTLSGIDGKGKKGRVEVGAGSGRLPAWLPAYPGAKIESHITGTGDDGSETGEGGMYTFTTHDDPSRVMSFYQEKCGELNMKVELSTATADGGKIAAEDEDGNRSLTVVVGSGPGGGATGAVTFKRRR
jgi:hypothetical protein